MYDINLPLEKAYSLPSEYYYSENWYKKEKSLFFSNWQMVPTLEKLTKIGDYTTFTTFDERILLSNSGKVQAFHNNCPHKAAAVASGCGNVSNFRCRYHGWTFNLSGNLIGVPSFSGVSSFCHASNSLKELQISSFNDLYFITSGCSYPLSSLFSDISLPAYTFFCRKEYELACNWKVFVDNYLDGGYHVNSIHPSLSGMLDYREYYTKTGIYNSVQISPLTGNSLRCGEKAHYWWLYPNLMINIYENTYDINLVLPTSPETCKVLIDFYFSPEVSWKEESINLCDKIQQEDISICCDVQKGLRSMSYSTGRLSVRRENGIHHFHKLYYSDLHKQP